MPVRIVFICLFSFCLSSLAQPCYLVTFEGKAQAAFDPVAYFDAHNLLRKKRLGLPLFDERDLPVHDAFVDQIKKSVDSVRHVLRWMNGVSVVASPRQLAHIRTLPFVTEIVPLRGFARPSSSSTTVGVRNDTLLDMMRQQLQMDSLSTHGLSGKGIRIAIFDAGFAEVPTHPAVKQIWKAEGILQTWDFYGADSNVYHHDIHGTQVLSCIGGSYKGKPVGAAPKAQFLLARTEHKWREKSIEEDHWMAAAEWADRLGAHIINSSLGYGKKHYSYEQLDGRTALVSKAAKIAADKGILVVSSNGNNGADKWKYLGAPADVPEVLSVGASYPMTPRRLPFSSFGPNAIGDTKPDVAAPGFVVGPAKKGNMDEIAGTSFSAPLVAGIAACLLEHAPQLSPAQMIERIHQIGHYYPYYDYEMGYGIPQCSRLFMDSLPEIRPTFQLGYKEDTVILLFDPEVMEDSLSHPFGPVLHIHLTEENSPPPEILPHDSS